MNRIVTASLFALAGSVSIAGPAFAADTTPPVIVPAITGTAGADGWYRSNVTLVWSVTDPESRIRRKLGCGKASITSDTSGRTYTCTAISAGGTSTKSVTIKRDTGLPTVSVSTPAASASYAAGQAVAASYTCADSLSGVATCAGPVANGAAIDTSTAGAKTFTVSATDEAGNARAVTVAYTVTDTTPPAVTPIVSGTLGNNGWYTSNVSVTWSVTDAESAVSTTSGCGPASITADTSASGATFTCSATSSGGTSSRSVTIRRDATPPAVAISSPNAGATYAQNQTVNAGFACGDALAGIATCSGTAANGVAIDTASAGTKSFVVTAVDLAGNATTKSVSYSVAGSLPVGSAGTRLLAWNDLGMHCADSDFSVFTLLPPFNNLNAQLIVGGKLVGTAAAAGYTLTYESMSDPNTGSINTYSVGTPKKTNFWDYVASLFGVALPDNIGMTGNPTASKTPAPLAWSPEFEWFEATGIPIVPIDDAQNVNPYPLVKVVARDAAGNPIADTSAVLPVANEIACDQCHRSGGNPNAMPPVKGWVNLAPGSERDWRLNVLRLHDEKNAANPSYATLLSTKGYGASLETSVTVRSKPIFCDTCHNSNALAVWGLPGVSGISNMTAAMHNRHANVTLPGSAQTLDSIGTRDACYNCHPGKSTQCLRGAMGNPVDAGGKHVMECQSCHGSMLTVGNAARNGWFDVPTCQSCHHDGTRETVAIKPDGTFKVWSDPRFASNDNTPQPGTSLYRFSTGHGNLQCESCHNSTHAEFTDKPSANGNQVNDNLRAIEAQGYAAAIRECTACHATTPRSTNGGPHGMHEIGSSWVSRHEGVVNGTNRSDCFYCHGSTSAGSPLAVVKIAKTFNVDDGRKKTFAAGDRVTCWSCHNGPNP
jgi:hypothetical protein